jgi:hypothetical protein
VSSFSLFVSFDIEGKAYVSTSAATPFRLHDMKRKPIEWDWTLDRKRRGKKLPTDKEEEERRKFFFSYLQLRDLLYLIMADRIPYI